MQLTKKQKKIVKKLNSETYTVEFLERCCGEKPDEICQTNYTLGIKWKRESEAFLEAVNCIIKAGIDI